MSRGPCEARILASSPSPPLYQQAVFPSTFRRQVGWLAQKLPPEFLLIYSAMQVCLSWRTTDVPLFLTLYSFAACRKSASGRIAGETVPEPSP
jgi:hypothetical protein